ncbi:aminoacyl-tRNA hydrolase [Intestinibaculum porci]|jgi:PTH1 family peptidyl-tRNA hydrolase|uniref:Peptidyl-tRNA hydrolase n=1 Tax=Intestinibaculum porci TaxID=2487118 RepID=A0A3G9JT19_9FIRM|nr:aminoacyl-tRNA hydrolase [Intestinibaculum porci]MDD6349336.1 aminoacyl-tRNA hydrolase [Intestinibaculum porci]MDD6423374.1 aminoacyl-tRNA hydrolase [Intestinibaculum porci]BBH27648.1 peptidyl-tRNA hydrolase [Intestinibaculum porci]HAN58018.1 aminoacyl-tRNA hydrolase [Erysipelotrichaceae bacterium]
MKLIVGLGNPGKKYDGTRHNTGFMCLDAIAEAFSVDITNKKFDGLYTKFKYHGEDIILLKPQTYMNNSGLSVIQTMKYFKIDVDDLLVIYDDMDLPVGKLRLRESGSAGGHNGVKSIIAHVGTKNFKRIRVGISKIPHCDVVNYVLGHFSPVEYPQIKEGIDNCVKAVECYIEKDFNSASNVFNERKK